MYARVHEIVNIFLIIPFKIMFHNNKYHCYDQFLDFNGEINYNIPL